MLQPSVIWELEGELLQVTMKCDRLRKTDHLSPEESEHLEDLEKRRAILEKKLREQRMRM